MKKQPSNSSILLSLKAKVYTLGVKKNWVPLKSDGKVCFIDKKDGAVTVCVRDNNNNAGENNNGIGNGSDNNDGFVLESEIKPAMLFSRTGTAFGQFADERSGSLYGFKFISDQNCLKFSTVFDAAKIAGAMVVDVSAECLCDFSATNTDQLTIKKGQMLIEVIDKKNGWFYGSAYAGGIKKSGDFPSKYAKVIKKHSSLSKERIKELESLNQKELEGLIDENKALKEGLSECQKNVRDWELYQQASECKKQEMCLVAQKALMQIEIWKSTMAQRKTYNKIEKNKFKELEELSEKLAHIISA